MGNMMALPQLILFFTVFSIFSYNAYEIKIMPIWLVALIVLGLGSILLAIFFARAVRQALRAKQQAQGEGFKEEKSDSKETNR